MANANEKTTKDLIKEVLAAKTNSGKSRIDRIVEMDISISRAVNSHRNSLDAVSDDIIGLSNNLLENPKIKRSIQKARLEVLQYQMYMDSISRNLDRISDYSKIIKDFRYKSIAFLLEQLGIKNSKIINRINNLKIVYELFNDTLDYAKKNAITEFLILEITYQESFMHIYRSNLEKFDEKDFLIALLLFDIPAENDDFELNIFKKIKKFVNVDIDSEE